MLLQKIKNLIKLGLKSKTVDEKVIKVDFLKQTKKALKIIPYGTMYKLPNDDIMCVLLQQEGNEESLLSFCTDIKNRDTDLNEIEVAFGIPTLKARLRFTDDDKIKVKLGDLLGGDFAVRYNELEAKLQDLIDQHNDFRSNIYANHTHTFSYNAGPTPASGSTNTGLPAGSDISVDFTDAKITDFELPEL